MEVFIDKLKINYQEFGSGQNILLLHGWGGNFNSWFPVFSILKEKYHVYALDLPGFGKSDTPPSYFGLKEYGKVILEFIKTLKLIKPIIIGHSFGGSVSLIASYQNPKLLSKLILVDSSGLRNKTLKKSVLLITAKLGNFIFSIPPLSLIKKSVRKKFYSTIGEEDYLNAGKMEKILSNVVSEDLSTILNKISIPTLIIWGEKDEDTPISDASFFEKNIRNSKLIVIPNASHFSYLDNTDLFIDYIEKFINEK